MGCNQFGEKGWESIDATKANECYNRLIGKTIFSAKKEIIEMLKSDKPDWQHTYSLQRASQLN